MSEKTVSFSHTKSTENEKHNHDISNKSIPCTAQCMEDLCEEESLHKMGTEHIAKALECYDHRNYLEMLRYSDFALAKLNAMKKRPLETISEALGLQCQAFKFMGRHVEALQSAKSMYNLLEIENGSTNLCTIDSAFYLVESSLFNRELQDAHFFAKTLWNMIHRDNLIEIIPADKRQKYVANAAQMIAQATYQLCESGGIPPEETVMAEILAITRARQSVEINTQEYGAKSEHVALSMGTLSDVLDHFSEGRNDEVLRLNKQALAIHMRIHGKLSMNVGTCHYNLGSCYDRRANNALDDRDLDQCYTLYELALAHFRDAMEIFEEIHLMDNAKLAKTNVATIEEQMLRTAAVKVVSLSMSGKALSSSGKRR